MSRQIVIDTETTGLEPTEGHRIIEIGGVELVGRRRTGHTFHRYLNPERSIPEESTAVHGIKDEDVLDCPAFSDLAEEFLAFVDGAELIIHNAAFDLMFLDTELQWIGWPQLEERCAVVDTLREARNLHPGQKNDLDSLCARYKVDNQGRDKHGALLDSELLVDVFLAMTGGQEALALEMTEVSSPSFQKRSFSEGWAHPGALAQVEPTSAEWDAHRRFLERIQQASGQCLWLDGEGLRRDD